MKSNYSEIRPSIKSGDLLAWSNRKVVNLKDVLMQIVRIFTKSEYTHVGVAWVIHDRVFVIEAMIPLVRVFPLSSLLPFYHIPLNVPWKKETEEFALEQIGDEYSIMQAIRSLYGSPPNDKYWQCAELAHAILQKDGLDLGTVFTPAELVQKALEVSQTLRYVEQ